MADLMTQRPYASPDGTPPAATAAAHWSSACSAFSMRSSVDNPLWDEGLHEQRHGSGAPLSPLETALQSLSLNAPRSAHSRIPGRATSAGQDVPSDKAWSSSLPHAVPATFEDWRPCSSDWRRAMSGSQPPAHSGGHAAARGASGRNVSLSPVCWSLHGSAAGHDAGRVGSELPVQQPQPKSGAPPPPWLPSVSLQLPNGHGDERRHASESPSLGPTSPQPMESPLKRLRLSASPSDWSLAAEVASAGATAVPDAAAAAEPAGAIAPADSGIPPSRDNGSSAGSQGHSCVGSPGTVAYGTPCGGSGFRPAGGSGAVMALGMPDPTLPQSAVEQAPSVLPSPAACKTAPHSAASSGAFGDCWPDTRVSPPGADAAAACEMLRLQHGRDDDVMLGAPGDADSRGCGSPTASLSPWKRDAAADDSEDTNSAGCGSPPVEQGMRKQEAVLEARRRADLADLRSIMAAGAAAHGCTSPAPAVLQGWRTQDDSCSEAASPRIAEPATSSGAGSAASGRGCGSGTPASEVVARMLATPGSAPESASAAGSDSSGGGSHESVAAQPGLAATGLRRDATGMAALLEDLQRRLDSIRTCAAVDAPPAATATTAKSAASASDGSTAAAAAAAQAALAASSAEAADLRARLAASEARAAEFQARLHAAAAAGTRAEQQLGRVLADWRASMAQMAATQVRLSNALQELAAGGGGPAVAKLAAALGGGCGLQDAKQPLESRAAAAAAGGQETAATAAGGASGVAGVQAPAQKAGYEADLDVAARRAARVSPAAIACSGGGQDTELRSSIAAAEARLSSCNALLAEGPAQPPSWQSPFAAGSARPRRSGSSGNAGGSVAALQPWQSPTIEAMGKTTPRASRQPRAVKGGRSKLRVPRLDLDGKLAALANFSATLEHDLPLSWSRGVHQGAAAAEFTSATVRSPGLDGGRGRSSAVGSGFSGHGGNGCKPPAAADISSGSTQISLLSPVSASAPGGKRGPGDALQRRLARKRHLAVAVEADASLSAARGRGLATAAASQAAARPAAAPDGGSEQTGGTHAGDVLTLSPPPPAAEVAIAAARHAAGSQQPGQQLHVGSLWRRMLGSLGALG